MKIFIVDLIYGRDLRIRAEGFRRIGDFYVFLDRNRCTVDTVKCEIVRLISAVEDTSRAEDPKTQQTASLTEASTSKQEDSVERSQSRDSREYELAVQKALQEWIFTEFGPDAANGAVVLGSHRFPGKDGNLDEVDVSARIPVGGIVIFIVCECKCYKRRVEKREVEAFVYRTQNLGANVGLVFTTQGFQEGAKTVADKSGVKLIVQKNRMSDQDWKIVIPAGLGAFLLHNSASAGEPSNLKEEHTHTTQRSRPDPLSSFSGAARSSQSGFRGFFEEHAEHSYPLSPALERQIARLQSGTAAERLAAVDSLGQTLRELWSQCFTAPRSKSHSLSWELSNLELRREPATPRPIQINELDRVWEALSSLLSHEDVATRARAIDAFSFLDDWILHRALGRLSLQRWRRQEVESSGLWRKLAETISVCFARLVERLSDPDTDLRRAAATILMRGLSFWPYEMDLVIRGDLDFDFAYQNELALRFPILEKSFREADEVVRDAALTVLCTLHDNRIVSPLTPLLESGLSKWKTRIAQAFGRLTFDQNNAEQRRLNELAGIALGRNLDPGRTRDALIRQALARPLENGKFPSAIPWLVEALDDSEQGIRKSAAIALSKHGDDRGVPVLLGIVKESKSYEFDSVEALCMLRAKKAVPVLEAKYKAVGDKWERGLYLEAIRKIDRAEADRVAGSLTDAVGLGTLGVGIALLGALAAMVEKEAAESKIPPKPRPPVRTTAPRLKRALASCWRWFKDLFSRGQRR